jgi:branched-chain amino acid transport system substrate-binding protein
MKTRFLIACLLAGVVPLKTMAQTPGVTAKSILLGQSAAFSGPAAQLGIQMSLGTKAYLDHGQRPGRRVRQEDRAQNAR